MGERVPGVLAEESSKGYLRAKVFSLAFATLMAAILGWSLYLYLIGVVEVPAVVAASVAFVLVWGGLLTIGPLLRRQRARLYENWFMPPYKPLAYFLTGREFRVPLDAVRNAEYYHDREGHPHFRVDTRDGRSFLLTPGDSGMDFFDALGNYFAERAVRD